jgi:predicted dehydrogenase
MPVPDVPVPDVPVPDVPDVPVADVTVAVGLAGTGDWALAGLGPALRSLPGLSITACASPDLAQARQFAAALAVPRVYPGLDEMLAAEPDLGLLVIATPDDHHPQAIRSAAAAGIAVYCEKPLAASAVAAADLAAVVDSAGIPATVGFAFRYASAVQRLRSDLQAGVLGTPWLLELYEHNAQFHPVTGRALTWKGDPRHAGGGALRVRRPRRGPGLLAARPGRRRHRQLRHRDPGRRAG